MQTTNSPNPPNTNNNQASTPMAPAWLVGVGILAAIGFSMISSPNPTNPPTAKPTAAPVQTGYSQPASAEIPADRLEQETALLMQKAYALAANDPMCSNATDPQLCMLKFWRDSVPLRAAALDRAIEKQSGKVRL